MKSSTKEKRFRLDNGTNINQTNTNNTVYGNLIFFDNRYVKLDIVKRKSNDRVWDKNETSSILIY